MNAQEIITELLSQGHTIRLSSNGERIYVKPCANDEITPNQMDAIKNHRQQILEELRHMEFQGALLATIDQIARVWPRNWEPTLETATWPRMSLTPQLRLYRATISVRLQPCRIGSAFSSRRYANTDPLDYSARSAVYLGYGKGQTNPVQGQNQGRQTMPAQSRERWRVLRCAWR